MQEAARDPLSIDHVQATWTYTRDEVDLVSKLSGRRQLLHNESYNGHFFMIFVVTGLAVAVGVASYAAGVVQDIQKPTVPLLCGGAIYAAFWIQDLLVRGYHKRLRSKQLGRTTKETVTAQIDRRGLRLQSSHWTMIYRWPAIEQVTTSGDLMLFWIDDAEAIAVPLRAIAEADRDRAHDLAKTRGGVPPDDDPLTGAMA